jgi:hypothetical protein
MEVCREEILPTCRNALNIKLPKTNACELLISIRRYLHQLHIRSQPYTSHQVDEYCHMSCCGWLGPPLNMMWPTVQRSPSSESCLGHERIYKIPRLHCHGSCHFWSQLLNESAIHFPDGDNWTTAFLLSVPLNLPTSALLLPLRRYWSACPGSNPASTYKIF